MKWRLIGGLAAIHSGGAYAVFAYAVNVELLWILWFVTLGILIGISLAPKPTRLAYLLPLAASGTIFISLIVRGLPIHGLGWEKLEKIEFRDIQESHPFEVTDPAVLSRFEAFGRRGRYITLWKTGYKGCTLIVCKPGVGETSFSTGIASAKDRGITFRLRLFRARTGCKNSSRSFFAVIQRTSASPTAPASQYPSPPATPGRRRGWPRAALPRAGWAWRWLPAAAKNREPG